MIFWGTASLLAGISYQGFGYQLKAVGKMYCNFTDSFEVIYLLFMAISIGFLVIGMSYCVAHGKLRRIMQSIAYISMFIYATFYLV